MMSTSTATNTLLRKSLLLLASVTVTAIGLGYGANPVWFAQSFLGVQDLDPDITHILRAVMGLYLALGIFWLIAAFKSQHRSAALLTLVIFCAGLVAGRILSFILDGEPAAILQVYALIELAVTPVAFALLRLPEAE